MNFSNAFPNHETQYMSPEVCVIALNNQDVICQTSPVGHRLDSPVDGEMREGNDNW